MHKWTGDKPESADEVILTPEDSARLLMAEYSVHFGTSSEPPSATPPSDVTKAAGSGDENAGATPPILSVVRRSLEAEMTIDDAALRELARSRARRIRDTLVTDGRIDPERIFLLEPTIEEQADYNAPRSVMSLAAH